MKSKRTAVFLFLVLLAGALVFVACDELGTGAGASVAFVVDGTVVETKVWQTPALPEQNPVKAGYTFDGWFLDKDTWQQPLNADTLATISITGNTNVYAKFSLATYTITYVDELSAINTANPKTYTIENGALVLKNIKKTGYRFDGWYIGDTQVTEIPAGSSGDLTLTAKWTKAATYTVFFDANGGTGSMPAVTFNCGDTAILPWNTFTKNGKLFVGWKDASGNTYSDGQDIKSANITAKQITLTAQWRGHGIDISAWQEGLNFNDVQADAEFVILRAGYTGYGTGVSLNADVCFDDFYNQAKAKGIPVGAYWYSCANTYEKGWNEAEFMYENCLKGKTFEFPIFMDVENSHWQSYDSDDCQVDKTTITRAQLKAGVTDAIKGFCDYMESKNMYVGVYSYTYFLKYFESAEITAKYDFWLANYSVSAPEDGCDGLTVTMWQYTDSHALNGTSKKVDANYVYKDFESIIRQQGKNGFSTSEDTTTTTPPTTTLKTNEEVAREVLQGLWGTGDERKNALIAAGYDYDAVQAEVNKLLAQ